MGDKLYLLVCEGPTDIKVVKEVAMKISEDMESIVQIQELSPQRDATTNRYPSHGWEEVRRWCKLYGKSTISTGNSLIDFAASRRSWRAEVLISKANGLIIQMDTDIVQYITDLIPKYRGSTKNEKKRFAKKSILSWLEEDTLPCEIYLLLSTTSTETWLLATHERVNDAFNDLDEGFDYEDIEDVIERLFTLGYLSYTDDEGKEKLSKSNYLPYAKKIAENLDKVRLECEEAENFCKELES